MDSEIISSMLIFLILTSIFCFILSIAFSIVGLITSSRFKKYPTMLAYKSTNWLKIANLIFFIFVLILLITFVTFLVIFSIGANEHDYIYRGSAIETGFAMLIIFTAINLTSTIFSLVAFVSGHKASVMGKALVSSGQMPQYITPKYALQPQPYLPQQYAPSQYPQAENPYYAEGEGEKFCTQCGAKNFENDRFCSNCGSNF